MLTLQHVPVIIEPGVGAIEAQLSVRDKKHGQRELFVCLYRLPLDEKSAAWLPMVPTTNLPHVFSLRADGKPSNALVVYDSHGRISLVYLREKNSWEKYFVAEEHAGQSVTQFSVRFLFNTQKDRDKFMTLLDPMVEAAREEIAPPPEKMLAALRILSRARAMPRVLPVAVSKQSLTPIKM